MKYPRINPQKDRRRKLMPKDVAEIKKMHINGITMSKIAEKFHVSRFIIWYHTTTPEKLAIHRRKVRMWCANKMKEKSYRKHHSELIQKSIDYRRKNIPDFRKWLNFSTIENRKKTPARMEYYRAKHRKWWHAHKDEINKRRRKLST